MRKAVPVIVALVLLLVAASPAAAQVSAVHVYYAGPEGGVRQSLGLADEFEIVSDPLQAEVLVLNAAIPDPAAIAARVREGAGLLLILGPELTAEAVGAVLGVPVGVGFKLAPISLIPARGMADPVLTEIVWTSAPQVRERFELASPASDLCPLVLGFEDGSFILATRKVGQGQVYVFTPFLDDANPQFQGWAYFNYLLYHLTMRAAGRTPCSFADYSGSPVPHARERSALFIALAGMLLLSLLAYWIVRRYSLAHPEALDVLVADRAEFAAREAGTAWEEIGFHRPLGGFLVALMFGLLLFIPLIIYQNLVLPVYILPSAQALGIWGRVVQFFNLLWLLFDMGTSSAFIKFFAQYRVHDPRRAVQYGQVFVWWQALSGAVQVALVTAIAGTLLPRTAYALYAWSIIIHTLIQIPGFYEVMRHALMGLQRFDYAQVLDLGLYAIFPMVTQPLLITLMVAWGQRHPVFGLPMGAGRLCLRRPVVPAGAMAVPPAGLQRSPVVPGPL